MRSLLGSLILLLFLTAAAFADPSDSCVRIISHGGSGTCIATGEGWTLVLSCWHCFNGASARMPIVINMRHPNPGPHQKVGVQLLAVGNQNADVALLKMNVGPVPYISPVAPIDHRADDCWSCGFDAMRFPVHCRPAKIIGQLDSNTIRTAQRPNHGRSGGSLIDKKTGYLVGVVSAYSGPHRSEGEHGEYVPGHHGIYASTRAIHQILIRAGAMQGEIQPQQQPPQQYQPQQQFGPGGFQGGSPFGGGRGPQQFGGPPQQQQRQH